MLDKPRCIVAVSLKFEMSRQKRDERQGFSPRHREGFDLIQFHQLRPSTMDPVALLCSVDAVAT